MRVKIVVCIAAIMALTACGDRDGVPAVEDPHHPVDAQGNPMKGVDFIKKYCLGKPSNETCARVRQAVSLDSVRGVMPKGW